MVIVIIGILAAMAVPRFVDMESEAETAAMEGTEGAVRAAHAIAIADLRTYPTVTQLATYVNTNGGTAGAAATGVTVTINNVGYTVLTYTDPNCTAATAAVGNTVACVGNIQ
jgi:MSHA pilin protein MshA